MIHVVLIYYPLRVSVSGWPSLEGSVCQHCNGSFQHIDKQILLKMIIYWPKLVKDSKLKRQHLSLTLVGVLKIWLQLLVWRTRMSKIKLNTFLNTHMYHTYVHMGYITCRLEIERERTAMWNCWSERIIVLRNSVHELDTYNMWSEGDYEEYYHLGCDTCSLVDVCGPFGGEFVNYQTVWHRIPEDATR
jgi:hypothetical protein